jgi:hypothetical protein
MTFQALRWLIDSASDIKYVEQHYWYKSCVVGLMGGRGAENGGCRPIKSLNDLLSRFHMALLASPKYRPEVVRWRKDKGIYTMAIIPMRFRYYKAGQMPSHLPWRSEIEIEKCLDDLLQKSSGKILNTQLNDCHADANVVHKVELTVGKDGFLFDLLYGCVDPAESTQDSEWGYRLAKTEGDEPFLDTLARALAEFERVCGEIKS